MPATPPPAESHALASKLAQLLAETQVTAAPHLAAVHHAEHFRQLEEFLEGLEAHTSEKLGPLITEIFDGVDIPESVRPLVQDLLDPQAQFSAIVTQIFLYGVVSQLVGTSIQPFLQGVTNNLWQVAVGKGISVPVSPAVIATAAARGLALGAAPTVNVPQWAYDEAEKSGVSKADIDLQASIVGTPPSPQELFELYRRGIIDIAQVKTGMQEGDTRDDWIDDFVQLAHGWLTPVDFIRAAVQGQMPYDQAALWAAKTGLDTSTPLPIDASQVGGSDDMFGLGWSIAGRPPGPQELAAMALRGIIPKDGQGAAATTFQQGIAESDVKTKWTESLWQLAQYLPPPGEIAGLLEKGGITADQATTLWKMRGVPDEIAQAYTYVTEQQHVTQDKLEAKGTILAAYFDQLIDHAEATSLLDDLGYRDSVSAEMLAVQDFKRDMTARNAVVRRISTLFGENKLSNVHAKQALTTVGIPDAQADDILSYWNTLRVQPIHLPTSQEIGLAFKAGTIDEATALSELVTLGYQDRDAAIVLSAHAGAKVAPLPGPGTGVTG